MPKARLKTLLYRYGSRAEEIAAYINVAEEAPLQCHPGYSRREIEFLVSQEKVFHLDDLVLRRTGLALLGELNCDLLAELAMITAGIRQWSETQTRNEIAKTTELLQTRFGINLL